MLTDVQWKLFQHSVRLTTRACTFSFDWNDGAKKLILTKSRLKKWVYKVLSIVQFVVAVFLIARFAVYSSAERSHVSLELSLHLLYIFAHSYGFTIGTRINGHHEELITFTNELYKLNLDLIKVNRTKGRKNFAVGLGQRIQEFILRVIVLSIEASAVGASLVCIYKYNGRFQLDSILPPRHRNLLTFTVSWGVHTLTMVQANNYTVFAMCVGFTYGKSTNSIVDGLTEECTQTQSPQRRRPEAIVRRYRWLTIINSLFNSTFGMAFIPAMKFADMLGPILIFTTFRLSGRFLSEPLNLLVPIMALSCLLASIMPIILLAPLYSKSEEFKKALATPGKARESADGESRGWTIRLKNSCRKLKNEVATLYYMDRTLTLKTLMGTTEATIYLLINF